jgi:hypothetical protein
MLTMISRENALSGKAHKAQAQRSNIYRIFFAKMTRISRNSAIFVPRTSEGREGSAKSETDIVARKARLSKGGFDDAVGAC